MIQINQFVKRLSLFKWEQSIFVLKFWKNNNRSDSFLSTSSDESEFSDLTSGGISSPRSGDDSMNPFDFFFDPEHFQMNSIENPTNPTNIPTKASFDIGMDPDDIFMNPVDVATNTVRIAMNPDDSQSQGGIPTNPDHQYFLTHCFVCQAVAKQVSCNPMILTVFKVRSNFINL